MCPSCGASLAISVESSQRIGVIGGLIFSLLSFGLLPLVGLERFWSWQSWVPFLVFAYLVGAVLAASVGRLAPYEDVRRSRWRIFPNVSGPPRAFLIVGTSVIPVCAGVMLFARSLPFWVLMLLNLVTLGAGALLIVGGWHLLFGERGIFKRKE